MPTDRCTSEHYDAYRSLHIFFVLCLCVSQASFLPFCKLSLSYSFLVFLGLESANGFTYSDPSVLMVALQLRNLSDISVVKIFNNSEACLLVQDCRAKPCNDKFSKESVHFSRALILFLKF